MACCRNEESGMGAVGNWYTPSGSAVTASNLGEATDSLYSVDAAQQVRLASRGSPVEPLGRYTCSVLNNNGIPFNATVNITNILSGK